MSETLEAHVNLIFTINEDDEVETLKVKTNFAVTRDELIGILLDAVDDLRDYGRVGDLA